MITLGQIQTDNMNQTKVIFMYSHAVIGPLKSDYRKRLITIAVITLSGIHCSVEAA
jgi:hypothetical protein